MTASLPDFENRKVRKSQVKLTNAGDGLSEALSIAPRAWHHGEEVFLVISAKITQVNHRPEKEDDPDLVRVHTAKAQQVVEVAQADIDRFLKEAAEQAKQARDAAKGQDPLPGVLPEGGKKASARMEKDEDPCTCGDDHSFHRAGGSCSECDCQKFEPAKAPAGKAG